MTKLMNKKCVPCEGGEPPLPPNRIRKLINELDGWRLNDVETEISHYFKFTNFYKTIAFVNAIAWIAHHENHHPRLEVGYHYCIVHYTTHAAKGLTENDFICAAKIDELMRLGTEF